MKNLTIALIATAAAVGFAGAAGAGTVYDNPYNAAADYGDCSFSTTCAAEAGRGDDYAAQMFTLTTAKVITMASFTELDLGTQPTDVNWGFLQNDGAGGLPGTILAAGTDSVSSVTSLGTDNSGFYDVNKVFFNLGTVALGPGTYYFAIQGDSSVFENFLSTGLDETGAAETMDGGGTWAPGYEGIGGVAVGLYDASTTVPEPATWAMMIMGVAGVGFAMRRQAKLRVA